MRKKNKHILLALFFSITFSQENIYRSVDDIKKEWSGYTSYQKEEMVSFSEFLFKEGHYERCLLSLFELSYKFPNDPIVPNIQYHIARCYEEMKNYALAQRYYKKAMHIEHSNSFVYKAANYRFNHIYLLSGNQEEVIESAKDSEDPYLIAFKGYAHLQNQQWEEARTSFILAQSIFNHQHYNKLITPIFKIIEDVGSLPMHNKYFVFFSGSLIPGGGQFLLNEPSGGQGVFVSVAMMLLINSWVDSNILLGEGRFSESEGNFLPVFKDFKFKGSEKSLQNKDRIPISIVMDSAILKFITPPFLVASSLYVTSSVLSFFDTKRKNKELIEFYISQELKNVNSNRFLDFPEPTLKVLN